MLALAAAALGASLPASAADHVVTVTNNTFSPAEITIQAGDTVTFQKQGGTLPHNVVSDAFSNQCAFGATCFRCGAGNGCQGQGASGDSTGSAFSFTLDVFDQSGTFGYFCEVHGFPGGGMAGRIIVEQTAPPPPPPPAPPPPPPPPSNEPGVLRFTSANYNRVESIGSASIQVQRSGGDDGAVSVTYGTSNGTAVAGQDYDTAAGSLSWADGESGNQAFTVSIINDVESEPNETVILTLSSPTGGAALGNPSSATLTIVDDDGAVTAGVLGFTETAWSVGEAEPFAVVEVGRAGGAQGEVSVEIDTLDGSATAGEDYTAVGGTLTWANGEDEDQAFHIPVLDDIEVEGDETLSVVLSQPTGGATLGTASSIVTIHDNETLPDCEDGDFQVCLLERFLVLIHWVRRNGESGEGRSTKLTDSAASFEFFEPGNVEVVVKMRDACALPDGNPIRNFWVFVAGLTNVRVELTMIDTTTGATRRFYNALDSPFFTPAPDSPDGKENPPGAIQATTAALGAFATCDG